MRRLPVASLALLAVLLGRLPDVAAAGERQNPFPPRARYVEAMQNPKHYLRDPWLRAARVSTKDGKVVSFHGAMASTFRVSKAGHTIALRVFHPPTDAVDRMDLDVLDERYKLLTGYLGKLKLAGKLPPEVLDIDYVPAAMEIDDVELPAIKLPWVEGVTLDEYVDLKVRKPAALRGQAANLRSMVGDMRASKLALGDLRHSNILIEPSGMPRLVDYDGMYAPAIAHLGSSEIGDSNYQHPSHFFPRRPRVFSDKIDRFSSIVIYLSMHAVAADPSLWDEFHDDNRLIFSHRDFKAPAESQVFQRVLQSKDPRVVKLAGQLARYAQGDSEKVPHLDQAARLAGFADDE